jgi:hypothetical protein
MKVVKSDSKAGETAADLDLRAATGRQATVRKETALDQSEADRAQKTEAGGAKRKAGLNSTRSGADLAGDHRANGVKRLPLCRRSTSVWFRKKRALNHWRVKSR